MIHPRLLVACIHHQIGKRLLQGSPPPRLQLRIQLLRILAHRLVTHPISLVRVRILSEHVRDQAGTPPLVHPRLDPLREPWIGLELGSFRPRPVRRRGPVRIAHAPRSAQARPQGREAREPGCASGLALRAGERLWAIGDVNNIWQLTHVGKYQGRVVASNILGEPREANYEAVPRVVFTDPQAAAVGVAFGSRVPLDWVAVDGIDERTVARVLTIATSVVGITIARLILDPFGL